jgi:glucose/arabinose dehydrogenase
MISSHLRNAAHGLETGNSEAVNHNLAIAREQLENYPIYFGFYDFNGKGAYSDPEFVWRETAGPTAIQFYNSTILGERYLNQVFVGEVRGKILNFTLDNSRTSLKLNGNLSDKVADIRNETVTNPTLFGHSFGVITDIEVGADGFLYVLGHSTGKVYRIIQK